MRCCTSKEGTVYRAVKTKNKARDQVQKQENWGKKEDEGLQDSWEMKRRTENSIFWRVRTRFL